MRKKSLLYATCICVSLASCSDETDDGNPRAKFHVPELTSENSIQFTLNADEAINFEFHVEGEKIAIDWGDGSDMYKAEYSGELLQQQHKFNSGKYRVKIWADELTFLNLTNILSSEPDSDFEMGHCPKLTSISLNSFMDMESFTFDKCPNLESLNIGYCLNVTSIDVSKCLKLKGLQIYTLPKMQTLDVSKNTKLESLSCHGSNLNMLTLGKHSYLQYLECAGNNLTTIDISGTPNLSTLVITGNRFTSIDVSNLKNLYTFWGDKNELAQLDFSNSEILNDLICRNNKLSELKLSKNQITRIMINANLLDAESLNNIFKVLPESLFGPSTRLSPPPPQPNQITFYDNPGSATCDSTIIINKKWMIVEKADE